jgi:hypothetical protein
MVKVELKGNDSKNKIKACFEYYINSPAIEPLQSKTKQNSIF